MELDGKKIQRAPTHFFIAFNPKTSDEFIFDATYTQFIEGSAKLQLNPILLKKTSEINTVFKTHPKNLRINVPYDEYAGKYDPAEIAELIYSTGRFAKNRTSHE